MTVFDFSRYLSYTTYEAVSRITLKEYAFMVMQESGASSMSCGNISSGIVYAISTKKPVALEEAVRKYLGQVILVDTDELFLGYINTPIEMNNGNNDPSTPKHYYKFYGQVVKGSNYATVSLAVPAIVSSDTSPFSPSGTPYPGFVVKADASGKPMWAKEIGFDPVGLALPGYIVKVNDDGVPEWLPESCDSQLVVDTESDKYRGYVLMITGTADGKMTCKWVNVNTLNFENPERGEIL